METLFAGNKNASFENKPDASTSAYTQIKATESVEDFGEGQIADVRILVKNEFNCSDWLFID